MDRRHLLKGALASTLAPALQGCGKFADPSAEPVSFASGKPLPWMNWAGNLSCMPRSRAAPATEQDVLDVLTQTKGVVRPVGASHSFSALVPTDETLITTDLLSGLIAHDPARQQAEVWAGTRLHDLGFLLDGVEQGVPSMPDIDYVALGGAIATAVHGTSATLGSLSSFVCGLTLATPGGRLIHCSAHQDPEVFQAARVSLGALGLVTRIRLQNQAAFQLTEVNRVEPTEAVLEDLPARMSRHRHFELLPLPHTSLAATVATDIAKPQDQAVGTDNPKVLNDLRQAFNAVSWMPGADWVYERILKIAFGSEGEGVRTGPSYQVFPHIRMVRFKEMEYTVPQEAGPACLREILATIQRLKLPLCFPLEYRHVPAESSWLSMFEGRAGASISVHQFADLPHEAIFKTIEPIFWKYDGRPHWGKLHTLKSSQLSHLYRHWKEFQEVRRELDPQGKMLNAHLQVILEG